jgi:hypothetical protein
VGSSHHIKGSWEEIELRLFRVRRHGPGAVVTIKLLKTNNLPLACSNANQSISKAQAERMQRIVKQSNAERIEHP